MEQPNIYSLIEHHYKQIDLFYYQNQRELSRPKTTLANVLFWLLCYVSLIFVCIILNITIKQPLPLENRLHNKATNEKIEKLQNDRFPYVKYNPLSEKFELYSGRVLGIQVFIQSKKDYENYVDCFIGHKDIDEFDLFGIKALMYQMKDKKEVFESYVAEKGYDKKHLTKEDKEEILRYVTDDLDVYQKSSKKREPYKVLSKAINDWGYKLVECSKNPTHEFYGCYDLKKQ